MASSNTVLTKYLADMRISDESRIVRDASPILEDCRKHDVRVDDARTQTDPKHVRSFSNEETHRQNNSNRWEQPRFSVGHRFYEMHAKHRLQPNSYGGKSKKDQLGSVAQSWGEPGEVAEKVYGMFEIEADPPSRSTSPFKEEDLPPTRKEVRQATADALERARAGQVYEQTERNQGRWVSKGSRLDEVTPQVALPSASTTPVQHRRQAWREQPDQDTVDACWREQQRPPHRTSMTTPARIPRNENKRLTARKEA